MLVKKVFKTMLDRDEYKNPLGPSHWCQYFGTPNISFNVHMFLRRLSHLIFHTPLQGKLTYSNIVSLIISKNFPTDKSPTAECHFFTNLSKTPMCPFLCGAVAEKNFKDIIC